MMSLQERQDSYNDTYGTKYPGSRLSLVNNMLSGTWMLGNDYKGSGFYGAYPPNYLKRMETLFLDITSKNKIMHLFSGSLPKGNYIRVDSNSKLKPDFVCNAEKLSNKFAQQFSLIYSDPPYTTTDALRYGTPMPNRKKVLEQCSKVLVSGGFVVWLDTVWPMVAKKHLLLVGAIGILRSQNHRVRFAFIMKKQ